MNADIFIVTFYFIHLL